MQQAVGHLFQAAAVFSAAEQAAQYGEQADLTASCNLVNQVIQDTLRDLTGKYDRPSPKVSVCHKQVQLAAVGVYWHNLRHDVLRVAITCTKCLDKQLYMHVLLALRKKESM